MSDRQPRRLVLWGVGTSRTLRAHWALHELGLDYDCRPILPRTGETQTREYAELNPRQKIPLLQDGDFKIAESPAIAAYLSNTYGTRENALIPTDPREHATWLEWCFSTRNRTRRDEPLRHAPPRRSEAHLRRRTGGAGKRSVVLEKQLRHAEQALQNGRAVWSALDLRPPTYCSPPA